MKRLILLLGVIAVFVAVYFRGHVSWFQNEEHDYKNLTLYDFNVKDLKGGSIPLSIYKGQVVLIVNVASKCGFTNSAYKELQRLYDQYKNKGFTILAFPTNQFGNQEPGTHEDIAEFIRSFDPPITFPVFAKIEVNGGDAEPLYKYLKSTAAGVLGTEFIKWNFTKFLIDSNGHVLQRFGTIDSWAAIEDAIRSQLDK